MSEGDGCGNICLRDRLAPDGMRCKRLGRRFQPCITRTPNLMNSRVDVNSVALEQILQPSMQSARQHWQHWQPQRISLLCSFGDVSQGRISPCGLRRSTRPFSSFVFRGEMFPDHSSPCNDRRGTLKRLLKVCCQQAFLQDELKSAPATRTCDCQW